MSRSERNKTINTSLDKGEKYLERCLKISECCSDISELCDKTILGDCIEVMGYLPSESVDLVIADPPYNMRKSFNGISFRKMATEEYEQYSRQWLSAVKRLMKPSASIYVCCDWESSLIIAPVMQELFSVRNRITWQREKGRGAKSNWKNSLEDIWFATKSEEYTFNLDAVKLKRRVIAPYRADGVPKDWVEEKDGNYRLTCPSNFWDDLTVPFWSMPENTAHPTQKPEKLCAKLILASSNEGELVFDPFLGSGTTSVSAKKLGRHYLGIERQAQYCIWAEERLESAEKDKRIQGYENGCFFERNYR